MNIDWNRAIFLAALSLLPGCHSGVPAPAKSAEAESPNPEAVVPTDAEFATVLHALLTGAPLEGSHKAKLAGVVQYQLRRAEVLFSGGHNEAAASTVEGALLLLRANDPLKSALAGRGTALLQAAHVAARRGDSGRAGALYRLARSQATSAQIPGIDAHLSALADFDRATRGDVPLLRAGDMARSELTGAMIDGSGAQYAIAKQRLIDWIDTALQSGEPEAAPTSPAERDEAIEAYRAIRGGGPAMIALCLRQAAPLDAMMSLDQAGLGRAIPATLRKRLEQANAGVSDAYVDLYRLLDSARREGDGDLGVPRSALDGALLWSAISAARTSSGSPPEIMPLAVSLVEFGMTEGAALSLSRSLDETSPPEVLGWSLTLLSRGIMDQSSTDQIDAVRRTITAMQPLLALAELPRFQALKMAPAAIERLVAEAELRAGETSRALPHLDKAERISKSADTSLKRGQILRQLGRLDEAKRALALSVELSQAEGNVFLESLAESDLYELYREQNRPEDAALALQRSLERILTARSMDLPVLSEPAVERQLARILEQYGAYLEMTSAYERALQASRSAPLEMTATLTDMARAALTRGDIELARRATQAALDFDLPDHDLIYIALWQILTERAKGVPSNGVAREVLSSAGPGRPWLEQLRAYGLSRVEPKQLIERSRGPIETAEAQFYSAMTLPAPERTPALAQVARSPALALVEVRMARDLTFPALELDLPPSVTLP